jgi:pyridoxamine 5'-phosphate oxidase
MFRKWFDNACAAGIPEANAMVLSTATASGDPSSRVVLLKDVDERGLVFFTNYTSSKGEQVEANPRAALLFFWESLERQVRMRGVISRTAAKESDTYFGSRPRDAQIGAWASKQSQVALHRAEIDSRFDECRRQFDGGTIPRPPHWGGYRLKPDEVEFWQGRRNRLHDRLRYTLISETEWAIQRLWP